MTAQSSVIAMCLVAAFHLIIAQSPFTAMWLVPALGPVKNLFTALIG